MGNCYLPSYSVSLVIVANFLAREEYFLGTYIRVCKQDFSLNVLEKMRDNLEMYVTFNGIIILLESILMHLVILPSALLHILNNQIGLSSFSE